jgi:hypothetical protein
MENNDILENTNKKVVVISEKSPCSQPPKKIMLEKEKIPRQITHTKGWNFDETQLTYDYQYGIIHDISENMEENHHMNFVTKEIQKKIYGYRSQDITKKLYDEVNFVDFKKVIELLLECKLDCYYCREKVLIIYEMVREPKQWSIERINNKYGHNKDNIVIACLNCNLRRKTMYHERFVFTKQMGKVTKLDA